MSQAVIQQWLHDTESANPLFPNGYWWIGIKTHEEDGVDRYLYLWPDGIWRPTATDDANIYSTMDGHAYYAAREIAEAVLRKYYKGT